MTLDLKTYVNQTNLILAGGIIILTALAAASCLAHKGEKHDTAAAVDTALANQQKAHVADLEAQLAGRQKELDSLKAQGQALLQKYAQKKAIAQAPIKAPPATDADLQIAMVSLGLREGTAVQVEAPQSILSTLDARVVWTLGERAKKVADLQQVLITCDAALKAQEDIVTVQDAQVKTAAQALEASKAESALREKVAQELSASLKIEKAKRWEKWALGAGGVLIGVLVKK